MWRRRFIAGLTGFVLVASCSATTAGQPVPSESTPSSPVSTPSSPSTTIGAPIPVEDFVNRINHGLRTVTSVAARITIKTGGWTSTANLQQVITDGVPGISQVTTVLRWRKTTTEMMLVVTPTRTYVGGHHMMKMAGLDTFGKPWALASATSGSDYLRAIATGTDVLREFGQMTMVAQLAPAIVSVTDLGSELVNGVPATGYAVTVDIAAVAAIPALASFAKSVKFTGATRLTSNYWLDSEGLVLRTTTEYPSGAVPERIDFEVVNYNLPVTIREPEPGQVYSG